MTAIFIMGVGLLAILTLFPLGALSMARAVREDRAAHIAANAASWANAVDLRNDTNIANALSTAPSGGLPPNPDGPGYPVYVDPIYAPGGYAGVGAAGGLLGNLAGATPGMTRTSPSFLAGQPAIARYFLFQDEIQFETTGQPAQPSGGGIVNRPNTYSCALLMRRPRSSSPALTELSVVVYANRGLDSLQGETAFATAGAAGTNAVSITYPAGAKPTIRKGGWVLDTSYQQSGGYGTVNGYFYQ
ncbi:MAG: hypothetical protein JO112_00215, partial [Planctomycetes bacterium]|nr:hypothetical protein [Planctomycetota bacterium]